MKFLFAACLACATLPLYAETEFADIVVTTDFPGGSADVKSVDRKSGVIHITPKTRSERGWPCWWYVKVEGAKKGQFITLKLTASDSEYKSGRVLNASWSQPDRAAVSVNNVSWTQTPKCRKEDGAATYRIEAPGGSFWLAWGPPFLPSHADEVLQSLESLLPSATVFELAKTRGGRSVRGIRIGGASEKDSAGKLPTLHLLDNGILTLTTALSRNHCRVYLSADGTGRNWSRAFVISSLTGGNVGAAIAGEDKLIMTSPANRRIDAWHLRVGPEPLPAENLNPPTNLKFKDGTLTWTASPNAVAYRVTPVLIKPGDLYPTTLIHRYAAIQTPDDSPTLDLGRQLLLGSIYASEVTAVDANGRVSPAAHSQEFQLR